MKVGITVYCDAELHRWLKDMVVESYVELLEKVEAKVLEEKIGLPWVREERPDIGPDAYDLEPSEGFEISCSVQEDENRPGVSGCSWMLRDFISEMQPEIGT
jgi:hypothetical protein